MTPAAAQAKETEQELSRSIARIVIVLALASLFLPILLAIKLNFFESLDGNPDWTTTLLRVVGELETGNFSWLSEQWYILPTAVVAVIAGMKRFRRPAIELTAVALLLLVLLGSWQLVYWSDLQEPTKRMIVIGMGYGNVTTGSEDLAALFDQIEKTRDIALSWIVAAVGVALTGSGKNLWSRKDDPS